MYNSRFKRQGKVCTECLWDIALVIIALVVAFYFINALVTIY